MEFLKISNDRDEQIAIAKKIVETKKKNYSEERVAWMRKSLESLATDSLRASISLDDLFYISIYDYWVYGNTVSEEIYFHFPFKSHEEKSEFMTFRTRNICMLKLNDFRDSYLFNNKYETYKLFKDYYLRDVVKIKSADDYESFVGFIKKHSSFVVKPTSSHIGIGVHKIELNKDDNLQDLFNTLLQQAQDNAKECFDQDDSFLLEELIDQNERLASIHPYSVNGIRITTLRTAEGVKILYPWFKVGANKSFVTSAAFGTYDAGIDPLTGIVVTDGFKENGESDVAHPLTGIPFKGFQIPQWNDLVNLATQIAASLPSTVNYVGWDMVLTPQGWSIMEGNFTGDFMWQMYYQKGFRKEFEELTGIQLGKQYWWQ